MKKSVLQRSLFAGAAPKQESKGIISGFDEELEMEGFEEALMKYWDPRTGDCRNELVFIGIGLDEQAIRSSLEACELTPEEYLPGPPAWLQLPDPFPSWGGSPESDQLA